MEDPTKNEHRPKVFISYSWDHEDHKHWVHDLAERLQGDGIHVILDQWDLAPGDQLPVFIERAVRESHFVLCICTPRYKEKTNKRIAGLGYEENIITSALFYSQDERKFIPVLRTDAWEESAPTWMLGKVYVDLRGDPYSEDEYLKLLNTLHGRRNGRSNVGMGLVEKEKGIVSIHPHDKNDASLIYDSLDKKNGNEPINFEFVNREAELDKLDPVKLSQSYWQVTIINAPTGYGKTHLLMRLIDKIRSDTDLNKMWGIAYVDLARCKDTSNMIRYVSTEITGEEFGCDINDEEIRGKITKYILEKLCKVYDDSTVRNALIVLDSIDSLPETSVPWLSSVLHDVVIDSYFDYDKDDRPFAVRFIISGIDPDVFWNSYKEWETTHIPQLRSPYPLPLSPFEWPAIADLVNRRAKKEGLSITSSIPDIAYSLQFLSGGHPQVISNILDELAERRFLNYKSYLKNNRETLVQHYVSKVANNILSPFRNMQDRRDIRTVCVLRLNDLSTLQALWSEKLISFPGEIGFFQQLCQNKILKRPNKDIPFYHDAIIRRILCLDFTYGIDKDVEHIQKVHQCAKSLYSSWIETGSDERSIHYFFDEWLFHALQIDHSLDQDILSEWKSLLSKLKSSTLSIDDIKQTIREQLESDGEVNYLYRERFATEDFSRLFEL
jgi:hypothetical protein